MAEDVNTGGVHSFRYSKGEKFKISEEQRRGIREGYALAAERKALEKRNKMIFWIVGIIIFIILVLVGIFVL